MSSNLSDSCYLAPDSEFPVVLEIFSSLHQIYHVLAFKQRYGSTLKALEIIPRLHMFISVLTSRLFAWKLNDGVVNVSGIISCGLLCYLVHVVLDNINI